jgi:hypothetical protein
MKEVTTTSILESAAKMLTKLETNEVGYQKADTYFRGLKQINVARSHEVNVERNQLKSRQLDLLDRAVTIKEKELDGRIAKESHTA